MVGIGMAENQAIHTLDTPVAQEGDHHPIDGMIAAVFGSGVK